MNKLYAIVATISVIFIPIGILYFLLVSLKMCVVTAIMILAAIAIGSMILYGIYLEFHSYFNKKFPK